MAIVGSLHEESGKIVKAFVVLEDGHEGSDELVDEIQNTLVPYKHPRDVEFVQSLPRAETGKIRRMGLRDREHEKAAEAQ